MGKDDVGVGQGIILLHDKELAAVGIWAGIGHGDRAAGVIPAQIFIGKLVAGTAGAVAFGIPALDHETFDDAVKNGVIIEAGSGQVNEIVGSNRGIFGIKLNSDVPHRGMEGGLISFGRVNFHSGRSDGGGEG